MFVEVFQEGLHGKRFVKIRLRYTRPCRAIVCDSEKTDLISSIFI